MATVTSNGIEIAYERSGPPDGAPLLLIHGVGAQLIRWPDSLIAQFEQAGFHVIRFDNRDVGLSTHMDAAGLPDLPGVLAAQARGEVPDLAYTLNDMAADAVGLLDALAIDSAHVVGVSLGGMIAQLMGIAHPSRVRSLAIIMSQTGNPDTPPSRAEALQALTAVAPNPVADHAGYLRHSVHLNQVLGSPGYPTDEAILRDYAERAVARAYDPAGAARQLAAGRGSPDRRAALTNMGVPTLVIHGADDPLIPLAGGEDIARHIPNAWMLTVHGMGHDLPDALSDLFVNAIAANTRRARALA